MLDSTAKVQTKRKLNESIPRPGRRPPNTILTEQDVLEIRLLARLGIFDPIDLAPEYGVAPSTVGHVVKKTRWKHCAWYGKAKWRTFPY